MGELLVVLAIVVLIFGATRLPQIGEGLGKAIRNLKRGLSSDEDIDVTPKDKQVSEESGAETVEDSSSQKRVTDAEVVEKKS
ncbi:MAG: twin-arginine translocase TatA/TatE family subunit [Polyangiales bacterium]